LSVYYAARELNPDRREEMRRLSEETVAELNRFPDCPDSLCSVACYLNDAGRVEEAVEKCEEALRASALGTSRMKVLSLLFGAGERGKLEPFLKSSYERDLLFQMLYQAEEPGGYEQAVIRCQELADEKEPLLARSAIECLILLGKNELAENQFRRCLDSNRKEVWSGDPELQFLAGTLPQDDFLEQRKEGRQLLSIAYYLVGLKYLGKHDRANARTHFQKCVDARKIEFQPYLLSQAFLRRMEADPSWPHWIPAQEKGE